MMSAEAQKLLRKRLLSRHEPGSASAEPPPSAKEAVRTLASLLKSTVSQGKGNSLLIIGPRGVGKTWVTEQALRAVRHTKNIERFITVHLSGLIHNDDRSALLSITRQLDMEKKLGDRISLPFAAALNYMLQALRSGSKKQQSVLFFLEEFDLLAQHRGQTLLYNLFDISMSPVTPVAVIGITCRHDVVELLEKRVKSRFSHRQLFLYPDYSFDQYCRLFVSLLRLPVTTTSDRERPGGRKRRREMTYEEKWNDHLEDLVLDKTVRKEVLRRQFNVSASISSLKTMLAYSVCKLGHDKEFLTPKDLQESIQLCPHRQDVNTTMLQGVSVLELCLMVAMKNVDEINNGEPFNFEMVYEEYSKLVKKRSHSLQRFEKQVTLKAFERLITLEFVRPLSDSGSARLQKEYQQMRLLVNKQDIVTCVKTYPNCPTDLFYWATTNPLA